MVQRELPLLTEELAERIEQSDCDVMRERMVDAMAAGAQLVVAQCEFASVSQRNLQRAGFQVAYTKATWKRQEA